MTGRLAALAATSSVLAALLTGCGSDPDAVPAHTADEQRLIEQMNDQTPQQKIEGIMKGPMPQSAKDEMIKKIKAENGIK